MPLNKNTTYHAPPPPNALKFLYPERYNQRKRPRPHLKACPPLPQLVHPTLPCTVVHPTLLTHCTAIFAPCAQCGSTPFALIGTHFGLPKDHYLMGRTPSIMPFVPSVMAVGCDPCMQVLAEYFACIWVRDQLVLSYFICNKTLL